MSSRAPSPLPPLACEEICALDQLRRRLFGLDLPATTIGRYEIVERIGSGGMGTVYVARDPRLDRRVALKLLRVSPSIDAEATRRRMRREAHALARLTHPNVVAALDVGVHEGRTYLVMEHVDGVHLDAFFTRSLPRRELLRVFADIAEGLLAAHGAGLVHRDFKPSNVIVGHDGCARVLDFGLVRKLDTEVHASRPAGVLGRSAGLSRLTQPGTVLGTPAYMAPEQWSGHADARSDQFSFCLTLYQALRGELPFDPRSFAGNDAPSPPTLEGPSGVARLDHAIGRGLAIDPDARHESMAEVATALHAAATARGRRWLAISGAGAAVGIGVAVASVLMPVGRDSPSPCTDDDATVVSVWTPERRAAVSRGLLDVARPFAVEAEPRVLEGLDAYAQVWANVREQACRSAAPPTDEDFDATMLCLDTRRRELAGLIDALAVADQDTASHAVQAVAALPSPRRCRDATHQPSDAQAIAAVRARLIEVATLSRVGRKQAALEAATSLEPRVEQLGDGLLRAAVDHEIGTIHLVLQDAERAEVRLRRAYFGGMEHGDPKTAFDAAAKLAGLHAYNRSDAEAAQLWVEHATTALSRTAAPQTVDEAMLERVKGFTLAQRGDATAALVHVERALSLYAAAGQAGVPGTLRTLRDAGMLHTMGGDYEAAASAYARALALTEDSLGPHHPSAGRAHIGLGYADLGRTNAKDALAQFRKAHQILTDAGDDLGVAAAADGLALALLHADRAQEAGAYARAAVEIARRIHGPEHPEFARALGRVADVHFALAEYQPAREAHSTAFRIFSTSQGPGGAETLTCALALARTEQALGESEASIARLESLLKVREGQPRNARTRQARTMLESLREGVAPTTGSQGH
ncbi:MAG: serine/threonine-protein kinase [Deltaproteobacteria bacterium]|nr:serine/threonine-protein kinase [Deltaproteobacteria bacterium]